MTVLPSILGKEKGTEPDFGFVNVDRLTSQWC